MYSYLSDSIEKGYYPVTEDILTDLFLSLGLVSGDIVMVHSSLSSLGYVVAGPEAVFAALKNVIGEEGTIVVPSQTVEISDPSSWEYPPVPSEWFDTIRENIRPYNKKMSFSKSMGQFSNYVGLLPNAARSSHPMYSFAAVGKDANEIVKIDNFDFPFGEHSTLSKLYDLNAKILMIGTDFETNTSLHLAEHFADRKVIYERSKIERDGEGVWLDFKNIELDIFDDYLEVQSQFFNKFPPRKGTVNEGAVYCFTMVECVDFAKEYFQAKDRE